MPNPSPTLVISASNIRAGGGVTHLRELLAHAEPERYGFGKVIVWAPVRTLAALEDRPWLEKRTHPLINGGLAARLLWQLFVRDSVVRQECDVLFIPGATVSRFRPFVSMAQNLLPFDERAISEMPWGQRLRMYLLRRS